MAKFIGIGAAGNKAVATMLDNEVIMIADALLFNTSPKDFPKEYESICVKLNVTDGLEGCGKDRTKGTNSVLSSLEGDASGYLDDFIGTDKTVFIIASSEGGTGSGGANLIGNYYKEVHGCNVHIIVFTGFEEDSHGMANTVDFFKDLSPEFVVHAISNKKFLDDTEQVKKDAEKEANKYASAYINILLGKYLVASETNIDDADLYNLTNTTGYTMVVFETIDRSINSSDKFNELIKRAIMKSKSISVEEPSATRIGIIIDLPEDRQNIIDHNFPTVKSSLGNPWDLYTHIQSSAEVPFVAIIAAGMELPVGEIEEIYTKYLDNMNSVKIEKSDFLSKLGSLNVANNNNINKPVKKKAKSDFLSKYKKSDDIPPLSDKF